MMRLPKHFEKAKSEVLISLKVWTRLVLGIIEDLDNAFLVISTEIVQNFVYYM